MVEEELRAAFERHEHLVPAVGPVRAAIERAAVKRRRRRLVVRAAGAVLIAFAVLLPGAAFRLAAGQTEVTGSADPITDRGNVTGPLNVLVLGLDNGQPGTARADTVLIAHVPADRHQAYLLSIPRDLPVRVPPDKASGYPGGTDKLSAAFFHGSHRRGGKADLAGGARLVEASLAKLTGLTFDAVVTVKFSALRAMTDELGGVRMCLERSVSSLHTKRTFPAGCRTLDGADALDLLRQRHGLAGGALDRDRHGRLYAKALLTAARSGGVLTDPLRADRLLRAGGDGLVVDVHRGNAIGLLIAGRDIAADDVTGMSVPVAVEQGGALRLADRQRAAALFRAYANDRVEAWLAGNPVATD